SAQEKPYGNGSEASACLLRLFAAMGSGRSFRMEQENRWRCGWWLATLVCLRESEVKVAGTSGLDAGVAPPLRHPGRTEWGRRDSLNWTNTVGAKRRRRLCSRGRQWGATAWRFLSGQGATRGKR